jgi:N-ethylmaleimide reductase
MQKHKLLDSIRLGDLELRNRVVMAPMTRARAEASSHLATDLMAEYYRQRAGAGLIITEGTWPNDESVGFVGVPGMFTKQQADSWKKVTNAVHERGGKIFSQLGHCGPNAHPDLLGGRLPVSASAINIRSMAFTPSGIKETVTPREMSKEDIERTQADFTKAAQFAKEAGFDGQEIHSSQTYLIPAFMSSEFNHRTDEYGGSKENRARLLLETVDKVIKVWGPDRVSVKLQPYVKMGGFAPNADTEPTFLYVAQQLNERKLAFLHCMGDQKTADLPDQMKRPWLQARKVYKGRILAGGGFTQESGEKAINDNEADMIAYGEPFIANPDLVERFRANLPITPSIRELHYAGGAKGYIDYEIATASMSAQGR